MALAIHEGGPADGASIPGVEQTHTRYYLPARERTAKGWVILHRYVFVPPRDGARCTYRWTGTEQTQGPVPGAGNAPDWSS